MHRIMGALVAGRTLDIPSTTPSYFAEWIRRCWHQDPAQRPTCLDLLNLIEQQMETDECAAANDFLSIPSSDLEDVEKLGQGGCGVVMKGRWLSQHQDVAIKRLHPRDDNDRSFHREFLHQVEVLHLLKEAPGVVSMWGACVEPGRECIVMVYCRNGSLYQFLQTHQGRALTWRERVRLAYEVVKSINFLHRYAAPHGPILHRDIKSLHCLLDDDSHVKVAGFGKSKLQHTPTTMSSEEGLVGTLQWTAPELLWDEGEYTDKCDVFSVGVVLWELATGQQPWKGKATHVVAGAIMAGRRLPIPPDTPSYFADWIQRCWRQDPSQRPTCLDLLTLIEQQDGA
jgi:sterile alpha motif and leucine zipper-containing kinase AZK